MQQNLQQQIQTLGIAGSRLLVAVSGGLDSRVLLDLLYALKKALSLDLQVAHLDHQLRPESSVDAAFVRKLAAELELPCHSERCAVQQLATARKLSLETAGRQARREFLLRIAEQEPLDYIVLGHHRDDQVETFLQRLLRGSGTMGLAAMRPLQELWWRPLLGFSREQIRQYAEQQQLEWVEDASNAALDFLRNRLRHDLIPQLQVVNPQLNLRITELCRQLQVDEDYWQQLVAETLPTLLSGNQDDGVRLSRPGLLALPQALRSRVLREALRRLRGDLQRLEAVHLAAIDALLQGKQSQAQLDLPGCWVARRYETLWLRLQAAEPLLPYDLPLPVPGELQLPCGRVLRAEIRPTRGGESSLVAEFSMAALSTSLRVRNWLPGDRFAPQGLTGTKTVKKFFSDKKLELEERKRVPLLVAGRDIWWVIGQRRALPAQVRDGEVKILRLELL